MARKETHVFVRKRSAVKFRDEAIRRGWNVSQITNINERAGKRVYKYKLRISKKQRPRRRK